MTEETKISEKLQKLVDSISELSVLELSELVTALQDKLGVSAMPVAAAAPVAATASDAGADEASGSAQTVIMTAPGANKISVIKALREINQNWGLKEAKDMTENLPATILEGAKAEDAKAAAEKLKAAGATVELK